MSDKMIVTSTGKLAKPSLCKKINKVYYLIGDVKKKDSGECYAIKNEEGTLTYYRTTNPNLVWDYEEECYSLRIGKVYGIVDIKSDTSNYIYGYFTPNIYSNIYLPDGTTILNVDVLISAKYYYHPFLARWTKDKPDFERHKRDALIERFSKVKYIKLAEEQYNAGEHGAFEQMQQYLSDWLKVNGKDSVFDKYFGNFTFGIEAETCAGNILENELFKMGLLPLKDGSIRGHEYTSVIIKEKYFYLFNRIFNQLSKNCAVNHNCSLHFHIGNIKKSKEFVVSFYTLYYRLQAEIDLLCPPYKRHLDYLANKRVGNNANGPKDHCKPLPNIITSGKNNIEETFKDIVTFFNDGHPAKCIDNNKLLYTHSKAGRPKWEYNNRYYSVNLVPFLFEGKQTIEFRYHSGTTNFYKAFAWALICVAMIQYAELNMEKIIIGEEKIRLVDIIDVFKDKTEEGEFIYNWLREYIYYRTKKYQQLIFANDIYGDEFTNDNNFVFKVQGMCPLTFKSNS